MVIRAHILLDKANGVTTRDIARIYDLSTASVQRCINKYIEGGTDRALFDDQRSDIKPFKIKCYCEKRDPDFESKLHDVLVVYKQAHHAV